ncbi:Myosin-binding protein 2-like protein [Drosera capensis]
MAIIRFIAYVYTTANKIGVVLVQAALEWTLIFCILINSLFSYLLIKFASHFGLKKPCLLCSRIDGIFEPQNPNSLYTSLVCENHAAEIGKLGYCSSHRMLVESQDLCLDCSNQHHRQKGNSMFANGEVKCSCCGLIIAHKNESHHNSCEVIRTHSGVFGHTQNSILMSNQRDYAESGVDDIACDLVLKGEQNLESDGLSESLSSRFRCKMLDGVGREDSVLEPLIEVDSFVDMKSLVVDDPGEVSPTGVLSHHLEFYIEDGRLVPDDKLLDSVVHEVKRDGSVGAEESQRDWDQKNVVSSVSEVWQGTEEVPVLQQDTVLVEPKFEQEQCCSMLDLVTLDEDSSFPGSQREEVKEEVNERTVDAPAAEVSTRTEPEVSALATLDSGIAPRISSEDLYQATKEEAQEVSHGELTDLNWVEESSTSWEQDEPPTRDVLEVSTGSDEIQANGDPDLKQRDGEKLPQEDALIDVSQGDQNDNPFAFPEQNESEIPADNDHVLDAIRYQDETENYKDMVVDVDGDGYEDAKVAFPGEHNEAQAEQTETPPSVESMDQIEKKLLLLARKETASQESLDGSILSEVDNGDGALTMERLESALREERKALRTLYAELEKERNAAAVATNETMAMISRLQEEKAAMQMEALHNQRMMEEQAEYDQEALQMMNEVIVKREMEKLELEKMLEIYKNKVVEYEERERMRILARRIDGSTRSKASSGFSSNAEESDGSSIDLNDEAKKVDVSSNHEGDGHHDETLPDTVLDLHDSLASFEEERLSILQQLKVLEEKLISLADEEEEHDESMKPFEKFYEENEEEFRKAEDNGTEIDFSRIDDNHHDHQDYTLYGSKPKKLPLFGASDLELEDGEIDGSEHEKDPAMLPVTKFELAKKRQVIEKEMGSVYERLEALEADREFLKNCVGSLRKGVRGLDLLQEILHHLRDLKNVENQARSLNDSSFL